MEKNSKDNPLSLRNDPFSLRNDLNKLSVFLSVRCYNRDGFIALSIPQIRGFWPSLMLLLQKVDVQVINATLSNCANNSFLCIHVKVISLHSVTEERAFMEPV
ncbi:hypothetical protein KP509_32G062600 [Ceratopteris richardii]|uniref:Uncharacterized protein n=1 Tax=Ceratopteris richardii TaxID=49495 RepID=A0A8T2QTX7_CERRI|nr:hypothetical protein KP509_32G062600 [Ceratopteris richardii]